MSASAIMEIYRAISDLVVGDTKCRALDEANLAVRAVDMPLRILLPHTEGDDRFIAIGTLNGIEWKVRDLCLWAPVVAGAGFQQFAEPMVAYVKLYISALKTMRIPTEQSHIRSVSFALGLAPWAEAQYYAIDTTLTVEEFI